MIETWLAFACAAAGRTRTVTRPSRAARTRTRRTGRGRVSAMDLPQGKRGGRAAPLRRRSGRRVALGAEALRHLRPVDHVPPCVDVIGPAVLVFEVVRVLPDVDAEQRRLALGN